MRGDYMNIEKGSFGMESRDLALPVYLDSSIVFDLLAIFDDGISTKKSITTLSSNEKNSITAGNIGLPVNNLFGLFSISLGLNHEQKRNKLFTQNESSERLYTTTSLFYKLRQKLITKGLLLNISKENMVKIKCGDFIEFETILKRNPIVETFSTFRNLIQLASQFSDEGQVKQNQGGGKKIKHINGETDISKIIPQIDNLFQAVTKNGFVDLIGTQDGISTVLSTIQDFYINKDSDEVLDGNYRILGKIIRIVKKDDNINLLRKTVFSGLQETLFSQFGEAISNMGDSGFEIPELVYKIDGPAILVKTIGIFI
jgi:hypothetical protein